MAIDDNTSYELTGAQVKDLANKIKAKAADNTFVGATSAAPGSKGLVPQPQAGDNTKFLAGDGTWGAVTSTNIDWSAMPFSDIEFGLSAGSSTGVTNVEFSRTHTTAPTAILATGLDNATGSQTTVQIAPNSISSTGFSTRVFFCLTSNNSPALSADGFCWLAIWR